MAAVYFYRNRHLLVLSLLVLFAAGLSAFLGLPRLEDPRIRNRNPFILTTLPGATAERMEAQVTEKLETELRELSEIKNIESQSSANTSAIQIELQDEIEDTESAFTKIRDHLSDVVDQLPPNCSIPDLDDQRGAVAYTLILGVSWREQQTGEQLNLLNRTAEELADRIRNVHGTDLVRIYGQPQEEISVTLDRNRIAELGLSVNQIASKIGLADTKVAAGTARIPSQDIQLEVHGAFESMDRLRNIPLVNGDQERVVKLGDVALVHKDWRQPESEVALANGKKSIFVAARMLDNQQVASWMKRVDHRLQDFRQIVSEQIEIETVFRQQQYTEQRLGELGLNLLLGSLVVFLVILFMMGWRSAILVGTALPLVTAMVLFSLQWLSIPLHQMSIFGLIVAIGLLIDNAIVVVDDVNHHLNEGKSPIQSIHLTVRHLFVPLLGSTVTTILSFLPIFLLPGNVGEFVGSIATTVILALTFSFLVSLTIIPALAGIFATPQATGSFWKSGVSSKVFSSFAKNFLLFVVSRPVVGLLIATSVPLIGFLRVSDLKNQFFPGADRNQFQVQVWAPPQSSISSTTGLAEKSIRQYGNKTSSNALIG